MDLEEPEQLLRYLRAQEHIDARETPAIRKLSGGISNRTFLVQRPSGDAWVVKQALPKLRVASDWFSSPLRIHSEAMALRWLPKLAPAGTTPDLVFEDHENHLLAMVAVPEPHQNWKVLLLEGEVMDEHVHQFGSLLGQIHRKSAERKTEMLPVFQDRSFFESLRLEPYYAYTATRVPAAAPFLDQLILETRQHRDCLVHGDYSPKNILIQGERLVLLDHEVVHFGEPAFDLGFSLTHLLSKAHYLKAHRDRFIGAAQLYWQSYLKSVAPLHQSPDFERRAVRHTLGCLLARVAGRSLLEYFDFDHRQVQQNLVLDLVARLPKSVPELIERLKTSLRACPK